MGLYFANVLEFMNRGGFLDFCVLFFEIFPNNFSICDGKFFSLDAFFVTTLRNFFSNVVVGNRIFACFRKFLVGSVFSQKCDELRMKRLAA